jgi:hypothetical protein
MKHTKLLIVFISMTCTAFLLIFADPSGSIVKRIRGQSVYVPAYSYIYHGDRETPFFLAITLSIRNTDPGNPITLLSAQYFDTDGKLIRDYQQGERVVRPMGSVEYMVKESDKIGGAGANFVVKWKSEAEVTEPIIETIMIGTASQEGISFSSRGQAVDEQ